MTARTCNTCAKYPCKDLKEASASISSPVLETAIRGMFVEFISRVGCDSQEDKK